VISLTGQLVCVDENEAATVLRHLDLHVALTRAEPGCLHFTVTQTADPLVWTVHERFVDQAAFDLHQARVQASEWGRATAGIKRDYVLALDDDVRSL
jgi:quinol monooxygenase YgiN